MFRHGRRLFLVAAMLLIVIAGPHAIRHLSPTLVTLALVWLWLLPAPVMRGEARPAIGKAR